MTVYFNFPGQYSEANFSRDRKEREGVWSPNAAKAHIATTAAIGGYGGYQLGKASSMTKGIRENNMNRALGAGGYKRKLAGAVIAGGLLGTVGYLTHKANPLSPIGKRKKDVDGRSDKGKKRK